MFNSANDIKTLVTAINNCQDEESMINPLTAAQWEILAPYLTPTQLAASQVLFQQGTQERTLFFVESGSLSVHFEDEKQRIRLAIVGAGSVVGEGAFFSHQPRNATVQAVAGTRLWGAVEHPLYRAVQPPADGSGGVGHGGRLGAGQAPGQPQTPRRRNIKACHWSNGRGFLVSVCNTPSYNYKRLLRGETGAPFRNLIR